jgi:hypothetical protein
MEIMKRLLILLLLAGCVTIKTRLDKNGNPTIDEEDRETKYCILQNNLVSLLTCLDSVSPSKSRTIQTFQNGVGKDIYKRGVKVEVDYIIKDEKTNEIKTFTGSVIKGKKYNHFFRKSCSYLIQFKDLNGTIEVGTESSKIGLIGAALVSAISGVGTYNIHYYSQQHDGIVGAEVCEKKGNEKDNTIKEDNEKLRKVDSKDIKNDYTLKESERLKRYGY